MMKWFLTLAGIILIVTTTIVFTVLWQAYRFWWQTPADMRWEVAFEVAPGESVEQVAVRLEEQDLVASAFWFQVYVVMSGQTKNIQAGSFYVPGETNYSDLVDVLSQAKASEVSITIPEGLTIRQIGELVTARFNVAAEEWSQLTGVDSPFEADPFVMAADKPDSVDMEGYLFPDTYRFAPTATGEEIVGRLLATMEARINSLNLVFPELACESGDCPEIENVHELLTEASIIEREVRQLETMKMVADIFRKRLAIDMPLQCDSTVNYVTGGDDPAVSLADLEIDSPYNTYKYTGLPPGPISNPGLNALTAVVTPTPNDYYYFLTTAEGEVYYAQTHEEHVANKARYLR